MFRSITVSLGFALMMLLAAGTSMEHRGLGRTGLRVSQLGFGCGNVGGLMVRGTPKDREQALARALELGINYFDTAPSYGDGLSEQHLGDAVLALNASVLIGNKFSLWPEHMSDIRGAVARSLEASLRRLGRESVDLLQLHNNVRRERHGGSAGIRDVMQELVPALVALRDQGKFRFIGITALGDTEALHELIGAGVPDTAQVCYNLLNPSADYAVPSRFPAQDFGRLLDLCRAWPLRIFTGWIRARRTCSRVCWKAYPGQGSYSSSPIGPSSYRPGEGSPFTAR